MQHVYGLESLQLDRPSLVTIGVFDGVHRGHQALIAQLVARAHADQQLAVIVTLFPHPDLVLRNLTGRYYLTTPDEQAELLGGLGVDCVVTLPFNDATRMIRAAEFVTQLRTHLRMAGLWITRDFALGYQREGNFEFLAAQGQLYGFDVREISILIDAQGTRISSTEIRELLKQGAVERAAELLGRPYLLRGPVVHGDQRGRQLGFPTANVQTWDEQILPANGVYACLAQIGDQRYQAMTNVGVRPTFNGIDTRVEAYLIDFSGDLYDQILSVIFIAHLRPELKFDNLDALIAQMHADTARGREILAAYEHAR